MSHEAGFPEDNPWGDRQLAVLDATLQKMIKEGISYSNDPGIEYEYSNLGFAMLGLIIKNVSGTTYQDFICKNIWKPLGMNNTYWEYAEVPANRLAHGYRWINDHWVEQPILHDGAYGAMGGMITTIEDFSKYVLFHLSAWPPSDKDESGPVTRKCCSRNAASAQRSRYECFLSLSIRAGLPDAECLFIWIAVYKRL